MQILTLNAGSSSLKYAVYRLDGNAEYRLAAGERGHLFADHGAAVQNIFSTLNHHGSTQFSAVGHRIVHGGPNFHAPCLIDDPLKRALQDAVPFAPLHLPSQLAIIEAVAAHYPELPQVACFDSAFHSALPEVAARFPLPDELWQRGIRRYGFHGLSYEYVVTALGRDLGSRAIIAHLGNGASMAALQDGSPLDTSMGLTPAGGFMMGTRSGDLDPGLLLYLLRQGYSAAQLEELLDHRAGLMGVSGSTSDMKELLERSATGRDSAAALPPQNAQNRRVPGTPAALAVKMFCYQARKFIGSYAAVLGGLDALVFTGGIGEHAAPVRAEICAGLGFLGIELDSEANGRADAIISRPGTRCVVRVVATDEDLMIARHTRKVLGKS